MGRCWVVPKELWNKTNPADDKNMIDIASRCLLIEDGNRLILIDTGMGTKQNDKFFSHYHLHGEDSLENSLKKAGFSVDDITDVFFTHLHFDHCGGAIKRSTSGSGLESVFKNACFWTNEKHWNWAVKPNTRERASFLKENLLPIEASGRLKFISSKNGVISFASELGFEVFYADGHTEKQMIPKITYKGKSLVFAADLLPTAGHVPVPYVMGYDVRPLVSMSEKVFLFRLCG